MAVLGRFPVANSIYNDYLAGKESLSTPALIVAGRQNDGKIQKKKTHFILPLRHKRFGLSENAIEEMNRHDNIVYIRSSGTGKSKR